ncbi:TPA: pyoverdine biosynthesis thioesterase PvdG, partial [Pseudomonas aeruginosa]|nr:pyoverdine biosynthesis thioesterase PvdG [Pseudomonas aeruginosa]
DAALHLFGGREDSLRSAELLGWLHEAGGDFTLDLLDGQHFFIREQQGQLLRLLRRYAGQHLLRWHKDKVRGSMRAAS